MLERWHNALQKLGTDRLLNLPDEVKEILSNCYDLEIKTKMLELICEELGL